MSVVDLAVRLRRAVLRAYPEYEVDGAEAIAALATEVDAAYADLEDEHVLASRAVVLLWRTRSPLLDDAQRMRVEMAPGDAEALAWVASRVKEMAHALDPSLELVLDAAHQGLLPRLAAAQLVPRMTLFHGSPRRALDGLRARGLDRIAMGELSIERLTEDHVEPTVALLRQVFSEKRELGMLPAALALTPAILERIDAMSHERLTASAGDGTAIVVLRGNEVVGQGSAHVRRDPLLGLSGGISIALRADVRSRGIGKLVYERLLERLVALDVSVMRGRTANPAVIHLAGPMGREVRGWQVERAW